jgi:hypothetical protein
VVLWMRHGTSHDGLHRPSANTRPATPLADVGHAQVLSPPPGSCALQGRDGGMAAELLIGGWLQAPRSPGLAAELVAKAPAGGVEPGRSIVW